MKHTFFAAFAILMASSVFARTQGSNSECHSSDSSHHCIPVSSVSSPYVRDTYSEDGFVGIRYDGGRAHGQFADLRSDSSLESDANACYRGSEHDVCKLFEDVADRINNHEDYGPRHRLQVHLCRINGNGLDVEVYAHDPNSDFVNLHNVPECRD